MSELTKFKRNADGLIDGVEYIYNADGSINWAAMIPEKFIVAKEEFKDELKDIPISEWKDNQKLILLGGFKHVAQLRGYTDVSYRCFAASSDFVSLTCSISWVGNFETFGEETDFESTADAHPANTDDFAVNFLTTIAENRAFSRCVRNFLKINILGKEEITQKVKTTNEEEKEDNSEATQAKQSINPVGLLEAELKKANTTFEKLQKRMLADNHPGADTWKSINDIPKPDVLDFIDRFKNSKKKK